MPRVDTRSGGPAPKNPYSSLPLGWAVAIGVLTFLAYARTLTFQFVHDDRGLILNNPAVRDWHFVLSYFTSHLWAGLNPHGVKSDYRPLCLVLFRINDAIFGGHVAGWHFSCVLIHVLATLSVFVLAQRIVGDRPAALFGALIFGVHPVHIESVAWISAVTEPLMALFLIHAYLCWVQGREGGSRPRLWTAGALTLYALGLLTKETAIVLPLILGASLWLDFPLPLPRTGWAQRAWDGLKALLPFLLVTGIYVIVRVLALRGFAHPTSRISWRWVVLTWPSLIMFYLKLLIWPVGLGPFYNFFFVQHFTLGSVLAPTAVLLVVAGLLGHWARRSRPAALAIPWLILPLLPVLNIQFFGEGNFAHDRYLYLPSVGFVLLLSLALRQLKWGTGTFHGIPRSQGLVCCGLVLLLGTAVNLEDGCYANDATFYFYADSRTRGLYPAYLMDYANALAEQGDFARAGEIYHQLIQAHPDMSAAYYNLGIMDYHQGQLGEAQQSLSQCVAIDPLQAGGYFYRGLTNLKLNRLDEAEADLRHAVVLNPAAPHYHFALGVLLKLRGNYREALAEFAQELQINPHDQSAAEQTTELSHLPSGRRR